MQFVIEEQPFNIMSFLFSGTGLFLFGGVFLYMCYKQVLPKLEEAQMAPEGNQWYFYSLLLYSYLFTIIIHHKDFERFYADSEYFHSFFLIFFSGNLA